MAKTDQSSPDLDDALNLFVGDVRPAKAAQAPAGDRAPSRHEQRRRQQKEQTKHSAAASDRKKGSTKSQPRDADAKKKQRSKGREPAPIDRRPDNHERPKSRTGRPPGVKTGEGRPKDKTSLSLDLELMDRYRKQSWDEHCQLGELVERALRDYGMRTWGWEMQEAGSDN